MARRLPPLNALRAFEAAARHLSFLKAARELNVTPGAVQRGATGRSLTERTFRSDAYRAAYHQALSR